METLERAYTLDEAAEALGISRGTLRDWVSQCPVKGSSVGLKLVTNRPGGPLSFDLIQRGIFSLWFQAGVSCKGGSRVPFQHWRVDR